MLRPNATCERVHNDTLKGVQQHIEGCGGSCNDNVPDIAYEGLLLSMRHRKETKKGDALEEVFLGDPMLGHALLAWVGEASNALAWHNVRGPTRALSMLRFSCGSESKRKSVDMSLSAFVSCSCSGGGGTQAPRIPTSCIYHTHNVCVLKQHA